MRIRPLHSRRALRLSAPPAPPTARSRPVGDVPVMHEEAEAAGIHSVYDGPWEFFVGGGGAAFDCDGSGFPSVFLAGGKNPAKLYVNRSKAGGPLKFEEKPIDIDPKLLDQRHRRLSDRYRRRRPHGPVRAARRRRTSC